MRKIYLLLVFTSLLFFVTGCSFINTSAKTSLTNCKTTIKPSEQTTILSRNTSISKQTSKSTSSSSKTSKSTSTLKNTIDDTKFPDFYVYTDYGRTINSKETYIDCTVSILNSSTNFSNLKASIRGRGNSTWAWDKKPYRIKFEEKIDLFNNGKAKSWTLIANHCDLSLSRNYFAYNIANMLDDLKYVTSTQFVNFYLNGAYQGIYLVCEQVQTGKNRVDIEEDLTEDPSDTGYFIEMDVKDRLVSEGSVEGIDFFTLGKDGTKAYALKTPDTSISSLDSKYFDYIKNYFEEIYNIITSSKTRDNFAKLSELMDMNSFADTYIMSELFNNCDVGWSMYMYKDKNSKLCSGPIWDFDISSGNCGYHLNSCDPTNMWAKGGCFWYSQLLSYSEFRDIVSKKIEKYKTMIEDKIESLANELLVHELEFNKNFTKWNILSTGVKMGDSNVSTDEILALGTWKDNLLYLENWLYQSLDAIYNYYCD